MKSQFMRVGMPKNPIKRALEVHKIKKLLGDQDKFLPNAEEANFSDLFAKIIIANHLRTTTSPS
jgi:hypothetical protein